MHPADRAGQRAVFERPAELPYLAKGETCPAAAELMGRLAEEKPTHSRARSQLVFALLCELADADSAAPALPPLVQAAIEDIRANYAGLYGVEELSERLGVSKSHLVRTFTAAVGVPPGKYLTTVRIEAAAAAAAPGVHAGRSGQPVRLFRSQLPVPGLQKKPASPLHNGEH